MCRPGDKKMCNEDIGSGLGFVIGMLAVGFACIIGTGAYLLGLPCGC